MSTRKLIPLFLLVLTFIPGLISAQEKDTFLRNQIKFTPTKLLDLVNPGIEFGYERLHIKRYSSQLTVCYQTKIIRFTPYYDYRGWKFSFEEKYYTRFMQKGANYLGVELSYLDVNYTDVWSYKADTTQTPKSYLDSFQVAKQSYMAIFKIGFQHRVRSFVVDIGFGLGIKYKDVRHSGIQDPSADRNAPKEPELFDSASQAGSFWGASLPMFIKLGYRF